MANAPQGMHQCPTRIDGADILFAHTITEGMCEKRQERQYHKCCHCAHNSAQGQKVVYLTPLAKPKGPRKMEPASPAPAPKGLAHAEVG